MISKISGESTAQSRTRRSAIAVCGDFNAEPAMLQMARELGYRIVARGWTLVCGGMGGIMEAVCAGGQEAKQRVEGKGIIITMLPGAELDRGNAFCDVVIPTGMGAGCNVLVIRSADLVVLVGGGSGTLSEAAYAWQFDKPRIALMGTGEWPDTLAGNAIDDRRSDRVLAAASPADVLILADELIS